MGEFNKVADKHDKFIPEFNEAINENDEITGEHDKSTHGLPAFICDFVKGIGEINRFMAGFNLFTVNRMKFCMKTQMVIYEQTKSSHNLIVFMHGY